MALLIDGHCHPVLARDVDRATFERSLSEADLPYPPGVSSVDSQLGLAVRRWCPPALGLPAHADIDEYLDRRASLGWAAASSALLTEAGLARLLVDTGLDRPELVDLTLLARLANAPTDEVVRLERVAEELAGQVAAADFADSFARTLAARVQPDGPAIAVKSIIAYRWGLAIPAERPSPAEVTRAAGEWSRTGGRLTDPVLLRHILWAGVDTGLPVQLHTGFGDRDLALSRADPALAQPFIASVSTPIVLLHTYPYQRGAGWLAQVYPHVYLDVGLTVHHLGQRSDQVLGEFLELAPFGKVLYSSDAYELPELYLVGAAQFRRSLGRLLDGWVRDDGLTRADADRISTQLGGGNAQRLYFDR